MAADPREPCIHCGLGPEEHHEYEPAKRASASCKCDAGTWGDPSKIPAVCDHFEAEPGRYCRTCEHDEACHA